MYLTHKTLYTEDCINNICPLKDLDNVCKHIVVAYGSNLKILDVETYEFIKLIPLNSPIIGLCSVKRKNPSIFVILKTLKIFIIEIFPTTTIIKAHFLTENTADAKRNILSSDHQFFFGSYSRNPDVTHSIRFFESRVPIAAHPKYVAVHCVKNIIHLIPISSTSSLSEFYVPFDNIVDIAFLGPTRTSVRIAIISDKEFSLENNSQQNKNRVFTVYSLQQNELKHEFSTDIRPDSHTILPMNSEVESACITFTYDGVIRIIAPEGLDVTNEHITILLEGSILLYDYFFDNNYLISDATGSLCVASFSVEGRLVTEKLKTLSPPAGLVTIDKNHIAVAFQSGALTIFSAVITDEGCTLTEIKSFDGLGHISRMCSVSKSLFLLTGRSQSSSIRFFGPCISCDNILNLSVPTCEKIFVCEYDTSNRSILVCASFFSNSELIHINNLTVTSMEMSGFIKDKPTLLFTRVGDIFLQITTDLIILFGESTEPKSHQVEFRISRAAVSNSHFIVYCEDQKLYLYDILTLKLLSIHELPCVHFIGIGEKSIATIDCNGYLNVFSIEDFSQKASVLIKDVYIPTNILFQDIDDLEKIFISTTTGVLLIYDMDVMIEEHIGDSMIYINKSGSKIIGSGSPAFVYEDKKILLSCNDCSSVATVYGIFYVTLNDCVVSVYRASNGVSGRSKLLSKIPDMMTFISGGNFLFIVQNATNDQQNILKYYNECIVATKHVSIGDRISTILALRILDSDYLFVGYGSNRIEILDFNLNSVLTFSCIDIPTSAEVMGNYLIVSTPEQLVVYSVSQVLNTIDLEQKSTVGAHRYTSKIKFLSNECLAVTDSVQALSIYRMNDGELSLICSDTWAKELFLFEIFNNFIFVASFNSAIYTYRFDEVNSKLIELGAFRTTSKVTSFALNDNFLYYSTENGSVCRFSVGSDKRFASLRDLVENDSFTFVQNRHVKESIPYDVENPFIDLDLLSVLLRNNRKLTRLLSKVDVSVDEFELLLSTN